MTQRHIRNEGAKHYGRHIECFRVDFGWKGRLAGEEDDLGKDQSELEAIANNGTYNVGDWGKLVKRYLFNFFKAYDNVVRVDSRNFEPIM